MDASDAAIDPEDRRPLKRTRQACDPCRRKKSKCSGERPVCATCERLRARCSYSAFDSSEAAAGYGPNPTATTQSSNALPVVAADSRPQQWQDRIESLETTLAEVLAGLRHRGDSDLRSASFGYSPSHHSAHGGGSVRGERPRSVRTAASSCEATSSFSAHALFDDPGSLPWQLASEMAEIYLKYCHCQPLPLFPPGGFVLTFANRDLGVVCGVFAVASRFASRSRSLPAISPQDAASYVEAARRQAMHEVASGRVELSTLQTLILVALTNWHDGDMAQLRVHTTLATGLARSARLGHGSSCEIGTAAAEERKRCYWSIVLLQRLTGDGPMAAQLTRSRSLPRVPASPVPPRMASSGGGHPSSLAPRALDEQNGILQVVLRLSEIWAQAQAYIQDRGSAERTVPPWSTESVYSKALEAVMQVDSELAQVHRYRFMKFSSIESSHLEESRDYWGPWLLSRLLYHTSICIFNHPILIMLQLQEWKNVPELFLQQTSFQREHHVTWILHFIDFLEARRYDVSDPVFAYCAAVLATIELHQSLGESSHGSERQQQRRRNYEKCLGFILSLSRTWPWLDLVTKRLEGLREDLTAAYESNRASSNGNKVRIDISSFLAILDISMVYSTEQQAGADGSMFGRSLSLHSSPEPPRRADLQRLPGITEIDRSVEAPLQGGTGNADVAGDLSAAGDPFLYMDGSGQSMLFTIDQVFGNMFSTPLQAWDAMGCQGGGGESMYLNNPGAPES